MHKTDIAAPTLMRCIAAKRLYATPEETAVWLRTERGRRIAALIDRYRQEEDAVSPYSCRADEEDLLTVELPGSIYRTDACA